MPYKHLTIEEREAIQLMLWEKRSLRTIARALNRSPSSISRELRRHYPDSGIKRYFPRAAHQRALAQRHSRGRTDRLKSPAIRAYVASHLKQGWSPEQISGRIKLDFNESISHEAIYQYVYAQIHRDGYGYTKPGHEDLRPYLRRKQKRRHRKGLRKSQRLSYIRPSIDLRPKLVDGRQRFGDWEGDSVSSINNQPGINTLVERRSGYLFMTKLKDKTAGSTTKVICERLKYLPSEIRYTLTLDNGSENSGWSQIEQNLNLKCFFAHPYHAWERGSNENANGLIREYFPKRTDFRTISEEEIRAIEYKLNTRPRKRLNYLTPLESLGVALQG